jgi:CheY-like chemotaxis protein
MFKALVVDDEEMILTLLAQVLERDGFKVATANSAARGAALLAQGEVFDIVITDLRMESPLAGFRGRQGRDPG